MNPYRQPNWLSAFSGQTIDDDPSIDLIVRPDVTYVSPVKGVTSALVVRGESLRPFYGNGKTMYLTDGATAASGDHVLILEKKEHAKIGKLLGQQGSVLFLRRVKGEQEEKVPAAECDAIFRVVTPPGT